MKTRLAVALLTLAGIGSVVGCKDASKSPDVSDGIHKTLVQAGLKDVSVSDDRDKGVVTLGGSVHSDAEKAQAESLAGSLAGGQVVANQIAVMPANGGSDARAVNSDLDDGIKKNLDAALIQNKLHDQVHFSVKNEVVTLTGDVNSEDARSGAENVAKGVPNVGQVVNELQVKNRKATSSM
jgi:osmotically-inducible protein OsmY